MFRLVFCVLCALSSPALAAIEVTSDTTIDYSILDESNHVQVRGDAVLTLDLNGDGVRPIIISHINLWDSASLVLRNGDMRGDIRVLGDNRVDFINGRFVNRHLVGDGDAQITVDGLLDLDDSVFQFSGGSQIVDVLHHKRQFAIRNLPGSTADTFVNVFSAAPTWYPRENAHLLTGTEDAVSVEVFSPVGWLLHANDARPAGDTNSDLVVDVADLNNVRNHFGGNYATGDTLPLDGVVDITDLNRVRNTFGQSLAAPVPEPAGIALLFMAGIALHLHRAKFRQRHERPR